MAFVAAACTSNWAANAGLNGGGKYGNDGSVNGPLRDAVEVLNGPPPTDDGDDDDVGDDAYLVSCNKHDKCMDIIEERKWTEDEEDLLVNLMICLWKNTE